MSNAAIGFGIALAVLGVTGYVVTGMHSPTALIPVLFGGLLAGLGLYGRNPVNRKLAMHAAVVVAIAGFLGSARGLGKIWYVITGEPVERPAAVISQSIMALLCLVFTALCVRSFIGARRNQSKEAM